MFEGMIREYQSSDDAQPDSSISLHQGTTNGIELVYDVYTAMFHKVVMTIVGEMRELWPSVWVRAFQSRLARHTHREAYYRSFCPVGYRDRAQSGSLSSG